MSELIKDTPAKPFVQLKIDDQFVGLAQSAEGVRPNANLRRKWCPREDSNLRPQDSYHFDFRRRFRVRGLDCPFTMSTNAFRCCPSSLYTLP